MMRILMAAGCWGSDKHHQPLDGGWFPDPSPDLIVWGKSFPSNFKWPDIPDMAGQLKERGYSVEAVIISRNMYCAASSQVHHGHIRGRASFDEKLCRSYTNQQEAYRRIFAGVAIAGLPFTVVHYDELVRRPKDYLRWLYLHLGLGIPQRLPAIRDENAKHWQVR